MRSLAVFVVLISTTVPLAAEERAGAVEKGTVVFEPRGDQKDVPEIYRLASHRFDYTLSPRRELPVSGVEIFDLQFPSPVETPHKENNTVHAEYYRPNHGKTGVPGVIVLDITGGDQTLSRVLSRHLAQKGIAGLFVQMAYYGPRRPPGSSLRLLSSDLEHSFAAVRQTVLDLRRATAWLESRPEIDKNRLGIMGTSLGSFMATLTAEMEPKLGRLTVLLGGADFIEGYWDHPKVIPYRKTLTAFGGKKETIKDLIAPIDPITCVRNLKDCKVLIVAAKHDEIVPPRMAETLWRETGKQEIIWLNAGHYSAAIYLLQGLKNIVEHFQSE
jgi:dipeptidyl aminopeptidase/acylaminoacyl peptidase